MIQHVILKTEKLQGELIVSDIPHSGKAYLRGLSRIEASRNDDAGRPPDTGCETVTEDVTADLATLLTDARRLVKALDGKMLLVGFVPDGPVEMPTPENPPAGFVFHTGFVKLTASNQMLAEQQGISQQSTPIQRLPLTEDRIEVYRRMHAEGMRGVPNVPTMTPADVCRQMSVDRLFLVMLPEGDAIGHYDLSIDRVNKTAELEEIAMMPDWRSKGIGRNVIAEAAADLLAEGIDTLSVLVATVNEQALKLYRSLGFGDERFYANWFRQPLDRHETIGALHTTAELTADLAALGVQPGMTLLVHSSLKRVGWIPGGAVALIEALREAVGPEGTIVMPAQSGDNSDPAHWSAPPVPRDYWPVIRETMPAYDPRVTPSRAIGKVAELFRTYPGALRSPHPSCSFAALGPKAAEITRTHPLADALGENSPNRKMIDLDGFVLQIGVDFDTCTLMHLAEYRTSCRLRTGQGASVRIDGRRTWQSYEDIQMNSDEFTAPGRLLESRGLVRTGKVGEADCRLFRAADAVDTACDWFRENRMKRLSEADRDWLLDYLGKEPEYNLFLIGDIENFGFDTSFQDLMAYRRPQEPDRIDSVLLRYHHHFIVYSDRDDFLVEPVISGLDYPSLNVLSGKKSVIRRLAPYLTGYHYRDTFLMKKSVRDLPLAGDPELEADLVLATTADVPELAAFLYQIEEFRQINTSAEQRAEELMRSVGSGSSHYVLVHEQGKIVACAGTTAENSRSAMVVGVATAPDKRRLGYATRLVTRLCRIHQAAGRDYLCLFYDNPSAGIIYRKIGFADAGTWVMATPPKKLP